MGKNGRSATYEPNPRRFGTRKDTGPAAWSTVDATAIRQAVAAAAAAGGAIRFGLTRDGGAYAIGIYGDGDAYTVYFGPGDDIGQALVDIAEYYYNLTAGNM